MNIYLRTKNIYKRTEIEKIFKSYGINIKVISKMFDLFIETSKENIDNFITIREETYLSKDGNLIQSEELVHLDRVVHHSIMRVEYYENNVIVEQKEYSSDVNGLIDYSKRTSTEGVYNWDDIFVELETMKSYQEMKSLTNKFSARTQTVSAFIKDLNAFDKKIDLQFNPLNQSEVLSFSGSINDFIDNNKYLSTYKNNPILNGLVTHVKNKGLFTRSSLNKSQRNYWFPSLNAGLPLVPKKDEIHEVTFMFHDLMHHTMPDLILSGEDNKNIQDTYIIHRMMGESITIVLADMVFIDELVTAGHEYNWSKRKIYPIYKEFKKGGVSLSRIKELIWANINFAMLGDESKLIELSNKEVVHNYKEKYEKFFIEDYRWTLSNYQNMNSSSESLKSWYSEVAQMIDGERIIYNYSDSVRAIDRYEDKVKVIFDQVWESLESKMETTLIENKEKMIENAFKNYMIGQLFAFFKYEKTEESQYLFSLIKRELNKEGCLNAEDIERIRDVFNLYIEKLNKKNIITDVEKEYYVEIFPIFETFFVFYERDLNFNSIGDVLNKIIK